MKNRWIFVASLTGVALALGAVHFLGVESQAQPPVFQPAANPYAQGIYANGIVESDLPDGQNISIYPEVSGTVKSLLVQEGATVKAGTPILQIEDSVPRATAGQQRAQAQSALAALSALRAQPRKETLNVARAQLLQAEANLKTSRDQYDKQQRSQAIEPRSVSREAIDNARNAFNASNAAVEVAQRQYELTKAGAWRYDIENAQAQYAALQKAAEASEALLQKYTLRAPVDGVVLAVNAAVGSYVSPQGIYNSYTQAMAPAMLMGGMPESYQVRCYIDEILIARLPSPDRIVAQMSVRGSDVKLPLEFVRVQPYVSPKIALSNQRQERVDVRVLPVIFRFARNDALKLYPGQLVDVYIGQKAAQ
jgi:HlyD family secretion protein